MSDKRKHGRGLKPAQRYVDTFLHAFRRSLGLVRMVWFTLFLCTTCVYRQTTATDDLLRAAAPNQLTMHEILLANPDIARLEPSQFTELFKVVISLSQGYFSHPADEEAWVTLVSLNTSFKNRKFILKNRLLGNGEDTRWCRLSQKGKSTITKKHQTAINKGSPTKRRNITTPEDDFIQSFADYRLNLALSACRYGLRATLAPSPSANDRSSSLERWYSTNVKKAISRIETKKVVYEIKADAGPDRGLFLAASTVFGDSYRLANPTTNLALDILPTLTFYEPASLRLFLKDSFGASDVMTHASELAATAAAKAYQLSEAEAGEWITTVALGRRIGLPTQGIANLAPAWGPMEATQCGLSNASTAELSQSWSGFYLSACEWRGHSSKPWSKMAKMVSFYLAPAPSLRPFGRPTDSATLQEEAMTLDTDIDPPQTGPAKTWSKSLSFFDPPRQETLSDASVILILMDIVETPLLPENRLRVADKIAAVGTRMLPDKEQRRDWYIVLAIESQFVDGLTSSAGAVGYGQLIPGYYKDFGRSCNFFDTLRADIIDDGANLSLSSCYIQFVRSKQDFNSISMALVAYNAGPYSQDLKVFDRLGAMSNEPANYVARYNLILERLIQKSAQAQKALLAESRQEPEEP